MREWLKLISYLAVLMLSLMASDDSNIKAAHYQRMVKWAGAVKRYGAVMEARYLEKYYDEIQAW